MEINCNHHNLKSTFCIATSALMQSTWQRGHYTFHHVFRDAFGTLSNTLFLKSRMLTGSLSLCPSGSGTGKLPLPKVRVGEEAS
jgi:hypothetical protein